jgi:hypothetical protein
MVNGKLPVPSAGFDSSFTNASLVAVFLLTQGPCQLGVPQLAGPGDGPQSASFSTKGGAARWQVETETSTTAVE